MALLRPRHDPLADRCTPSPRAAASRFGAMTAVLP